MTLIELIRTMERIAADQPAIKTIVENDIYILNHRPDVRYQAFAWTQGQHTASSVDDGRTDYTFNLFYVDRLLPDHSNMLEIQAAAIRVLKNILQTLADTTDVEVGSMTFQPFTERFVDDCAGVYVTTTLTAYDSTICPEQYDRIDFEGNGTDMVTFDGDGYIEDGILVINDI